MAHEFIAKNGIVSQGNIVISGSIITTGAITVSGSIASASYALSASYASSSTSASYAVSSSYALSSSYSLSSSYAANATSASYALSSSYALDSTLHNGTASAVFATTGSNNLVGDQHITSVADASAFAATASLYTDGGLQVAKNAYFSSSMFIKGNLTIYGTQSVAYITSSQLNISTNVITVNTATPSVRFGGLSVYDSGSTGTGATGSLFWDSQNNNWIYSRESGSTYAGGMLISGPRLLSGSAMGTEQGTTACMVMVGQGGDHITSSLIYHDSTVTCIPGAIVGGTMSGTTIYGSTAVCSPVGKFTSCIDAGSGTFSSSVTAKGTLLLGDAGVTNAIINSADGMYFNLDTDLSGGSPEFMFGKGRSGAGSGGTTLFTISCTGAATFSSTITGTTIYGSTTVCSPSIIACTTSAAAITIDGYSKLSFKDRGTEYGTINASRYNFGGELTMMSFQSGNCFLFLNGTNCLMFIGSNGNVGVGTTSPSSKLHTANGDIAIGNGNQTSGDFSQAQALHFLNETTIPLATIKAVRTNWAQGQTDLTFSTYNSGMGEKMRITTEGNILLVSGATIYNSTGNLYVRAGTSGDLILGAGGSNDKMRITSGGSAIFQGSLGICNGGAINMTIPNGNNGGAIRMACCTGANEGDMFLTGGSGNTGILIAGAGHVGIGTLNMSTEGNLFLGAKGTTEGGQMIFQKATSFQCATHIDNYSNCFRIMSGTDTGSTTVNMTINHTNGATTFGSTLTAATITGTNGVNSASTVSSIPFTTWTTLQTIDSNTTGMYLVVIGLTGGGGALADWTATGIVYSNGSTAAFLTGPTNGSLVQLRISGLAIQVYQNGTNPSVSLSYKLLKIS